MPRPSGTVFRLVDAALLLGLPGLLSVLGHQSSPQSTFSRGAALNRRSLTPPSPSTTTPTTTPSNTATAAPGVQNDTACTQPPLTRAAWVNLGIDKYLANVPNGANLSLQEYATTVGAPNFICGVGDKCSAGQLCSPVRSPAWEVLLAAQEWNNFQNKVYDAIGTASQIVTAISGSLVSDLYPPRHTGPLWKLMNSFSLAAGISVTVALGLEGLMFLISSAVIAPYLSMITLAAVAATTGAAGGIGVALARSPHEPTAFERWSNYAFYLSEWQHYMQKAVAKNTRVVVEAGVSSHLGIISYVTNGTFFYDRPTTNEADLIAGLKNTTTARTITDILRSQGAFVTIASDKCTGKGPGGAWEGKDKLSYCSPNGTMMNIIHGRKKKVNNKWFNADLIEKKYGVSVQYIAEQSYNCQLKHNTFNFDPYESGSFPSSLDAECISNLAVCDFRISDISDAKKDKKSTMEACRKAGKLPI